MLSLAELLRSRPAQFMPAINRLLPFSAPSLLLSALTFACVCFSLSAVEPEVTLAERKFFENEVRPLLVANCFKCHSEKKQSGELRLDSIGAILAGGESGAAIEEHDPDASLLMEAIRWESFEMPPSGKLSADKIAVFEKWIKLGAPWPGGDREVRKKTDLPKISDEDRQWWAYQPITAHKPPEVNDKNWSTGSIDPFIYRQLIANGLTPAAPADRATLIRRASLDIRGLTPTPAEVKAFLADDSADAYERLIDSFLESPAYGERQATFWLDLVRYAESDGYKADDHRPHAWRYRDYVVNAFNQDKSYSRFVQEQIAGDELVALADAAGESIDRLECLTATGYLRNGIYEYNQRDVETQWDGMVNDVVDTTADVFLGMGMGCAKCHDHKFDPLLQEDYFRLKAFFAPMHFVEQPAPASDLAEHRKEWANWREKTAKLQDEISAIEDPIYRRVEKSAANKFPPVVKAMMLKEAEQRTPYEIQMVAMADRQVARDRARVKFPDKLKEDQKETWVDLQRRLNAIPKPTEGPTIRMATDVSSEAPATMIPGVRDAIPIEPGYPTIFTSAPAELVAVDGETTGRRLTLARWLTNDDNPLSPRVMVNRIWQQHFGVGLVPTTSDFGHLGSPPSHPELLDSLAAEFVAGGWKMKRIHRMILLSSTYRQSAVNEERSAYQGIDPENRLLWRAPVRRMDAEQIRDAMLFASGELLDNRGGVSEKMSGRRRAVYSKISRNSRDPLLDAFDFPDRFSSASDRNTTTTPVQSLLMINGSWALARAKGLASVTKKVSSSDDVRIREAWLRLFGRPPEPDELAAALSFLRQQGASTEPAEPAKPVTTAFNGKFGLDFSSNRAQWFEAQDADLPKSTELTVETTFELISLFPDATVRTLAAKWNNDNDKIGWAVGVTSTRSGYKPRNLILQLVTESGYEVIASGLRPELNKPYQAAVVLRLNEQGQSEATFYLKAIGENEKLQTVVVPVKAKGLPANDFAITLGGRDGSSRHFWHGVIGPTRIAPKAVSADALQLAKEGSPAVKGAFDWTFANQSLKSNNGQHLLTRKSSTAANSSGDSMVDLCHVLFNSNEFLYID